MKKISLLLCAAIGFSAVAFASDPVARIHPRLLADSSDFMRIRALKDELSAATRRKVVQIAEAELTTAPVVYKKEGRRLLSVSREALRRICACAMAWRLTDDRRFADRAVKEALAVSAFQDWNNSHFLDTAEMCLAAAIAYDWCFDAIGSEDRKTIEKAILSKALVKEDGRLIDGWFTHAENNWGQVCQAGLCAGAIALSDIAPSVSDRVIARAVKCLPRCMAAYAEGGFPEGPAGYWFYAMDFTAVVLTAFEKAYGTDFGFGATPGLDKQADFIDNLTGPTGQMFNFADGGHYKTPFKGVNRHPAISEWFLADKFGTPEVLFRHERGLLAQAVNDPKRTGFDRLFPLTLLWMKDAEQVSVPSAPKSVRVGGRVPVGVLRAGEGREGSFAALKGGKGSDHHGHLDIGSFVYDADGIRWAIDLGAENYNAVEQSGVKLWDMSDDSPRWNIFRLGTSAHNVFSLDGKNAKASGFADVKVDGNTAAADLTACYPGAAKAVRTMTLDAQTLTIHDELEGLAPGTVVNWHFITDSRAEIAGPGEVALSALGRTRIVSSSAADWKVVSIAAPPQPYESPNEGASRVEFEEKAPSSGKVELTVTFHATVGMLIDRASAPWNALDDAALRARAVMALTNVAPTVTAKKMMPPSGDKHDYMSFGPYWWPDPSKADGLPYVRRDGEENPQSRADSDRVRLERMVDDVEVLAAAARRFGDRAAGAEAVRKLRVFFLDPKTAMNPNLNFGQAIPGRCTGRGIGLIDTRLFVTRLLDAIVILEGTGDLPKDDLSGLKTWFGNYLDWMLTSPIGLDEQDEHNNHGTAYDLQAAGLAWFVGRPDLARKILQEDTKRRIASQIQPDGSQPHELARTRALTYATMNATLFCELALLGEKVGVDLWRYETADGRSICKTVEWLMPYWRREKAWTLKQITPILPDIGRDASAIYSRHFKVLAEPMRQATVGCDAPTVAGLESLRSLAADRGYEITAVDSESDFVKVAYVLRPSAESFIRCELALPAGREWDGRLWGFGNGGGAGGVHVDVDVARRGSVGVHTDMGTSRGVYGKPEVVRDFGWRATHLMTVSAKELATAYFGRAPSKSYFIGGSTGGGQGFHEALRFPADYDGIISYVPANTRIPLHVYFAWNLRLMKTADGKDVFSAAELSAVEQAAIDWFADKDADCARGKFLTDSRYDAETARAVLDMAKGKCSSLAEGDKLERLHKMLEGPVLGGKRVHAGVPFSASFAAAAGNQWMLQWFLGPDRALHTVTDEELERWLRTWGPDCDACDAGFKAFAARGGKMIVIGGLEDSVVPYPSMIDWYERAAEEMGTLADLEQSCRLYLLPGRAHGQGRGCGGIVGDTQIIVDWVERGAAPFEVKSPLRGGGELSVKPYPHNWTPKAALGCAMRNI